MARNWTMADAIKAIAEQNMEDVKDIYRRFPTFAMMATRAVGGDNEAACNIIASLPEWATVNKFEKAMKNDVETVEESTSDEQEDVTTTEEPEEKPKAKPAKKAEKPAPKKTKAENTGKKLSSKEAYALISKSGRMKDLKAKGYEAKISDMLEYLEKYPINEDAAADDEVETEVKTDEYADKTPMELFKECKKAGIKAAPKKDKSYYIELLKKANEASEPDDDDSWDDEEEVVEEKPKKAKAKAEKKPAKKAKPAPKVEEPEDDDDEDWDI